MSITAVYHLNVNCRDLDVSLGFYQSLLGYTPVVRTTPPPQPGAAFGLQEAQWDAWILADTNAAAGQGGVVLDLLQWLVPAPEAAPAAANDGGFTGLLVDHPDPARIGDGETRSDGTVLLTDPDGTLIEVRKGGRVRLAGLSIRVQDLQRAVTFYRDALDFDVTSEFGLTHKSNGFEVRLQHAPENPGMSNERKANWLGLFRLAFTTDDLDADHQRLCEAGALPYSDPVSLDMGPGLPDDLRCAFFGDPDGACVELIEAPT